MALPKRRKSKSKARMRRQHETIKVPNLRPCPKCGVYTLPHRVCSECGHYKMQLVVQPKVKIKES